MIRVFRLAAVFLLVLVGACVPAPRGPVVSGALPPQPPETARLIFYRTLEFYDSQAMSAVYLNGVATGVSQNGAVLYRDVAPGRYDLAVFSPRPYPDQFKTVVVKAGDVFYIRIATLPKPPCGRFDPGEPCNTDTFVVTVVDPAIGLQEIQGLRLIAG